MVSMNGAEPDNDSLKTSSHVLFTLGMLQNLSTMDPSLMLVMYGAMVLLCGRCSHMANLRMEK